MNRDQLARVRRLEQQAAGLVRPQEPGPGLQSAIRAAEHAYLRHINEHGYETADDAYAVALATFEAQQRADHHPE